MRREIITCDVCGAEKKEANHWFVVDADGDFRAADGDFRAWHYDSGYTGEHICGLACLHKRIEKWASKKSK